jgi:hypothetical protein
MATDYPTDNVGDDLGTFAPKAELLRDETREPSDQADSA